MESDNNTNTDLSESNVKNEIYKKRVLVLLAILILVTIIWIGSLIKNIHDKNYFNRELTKSNKSIILVGDSYGITHTNDSGNGWIGWKDAFDDLCPDVDCYSTAVGGSGFIGGNDDTFESQFLEICNEVDNLEMITDIIVLGGYNDATTHQSKEELSDAVKSFVSVASNACPNATISMMYVSVDYSKVDRMNRLREYSAIFEEICNANGIKFVEDSDLILYKKSEIFWDDSDKNSGYHPSTDGAKKIAICIAEYLLYGEIKTIE